MKNPNWYLVASVLFGLGGLCFLVAAFLAREQFPRPFFGVAGLCQLVSSIGFFSVWRKAR